MVEQIVMLVWLVLKGYGKKIACCINDQDQAFQSSEVACGGKGCPCVAKSWVCNMAEGTMGLPTLPKKTFPIACHTWRLKCHH